MIRQNLLHIVKQVDKSAPMCYNIEKYGFIQSEDEMAVFFEDHGQDFDFYPLLGTVQYVPPALGRDSVSREPKKKATVCVSALRSCSVVCIQ